MPFGYLEFSRAIGRELCPHMRVRRRRRRCRCRARARARARVWVWVWVRYPAWFFFELGLTGMGCEHTRSATRTRPAPLRIRTALVGQPTVATVGSNHCNGSDRTVATFRWVQTRWPLLERFFLRHTKTKRKSSLLSLNSELLIKFLRSELGSGVLKQLPARSGKVSF